MKLIDRNKMINPKLSYIKRQLKESVEKELRIVITREGDYAVGDAYYWDHCALASLVTKHTDYAVGWFVETSKGIAYKEDSEPMLFAERVIEKLGFNYKTGFLR